MKKIVLFLTLILFIITLSGCQSLNVISEYLYNDKDYEIGNKAYDPSVYNIETIEVDWIVGNVYILQSSNHEIIIREETDIEIEDKFKMHYKLEDNTLDIKFAKSCNLLEYKYKIKNLYIFLPSQINEITINNVSSDISINYVNIKDLEINNASGDIVIEDATIDELQINNVSGEIIILDDEINSVEIDTTSGDLGMSFLKMPHELDISSTSANITLYILNTDIVSIEFETISGKLESNLQYTKNEDTYVFNGKLDDNYEVETVSGSLVINKK